MMFHTKHVSVSADHACFEGKFACRVSYAWALGMITEGKVSKRRASHTSNTSKQSSLNSTFARKVEIPNWSFITIHNGSYFHVNGQQIFTLRVSFSAHQLSHCLHEVLKISNSKLNEWFGPMSGLASAKAAANDCRGLSLCLSSCFVVF